MVSEPCGPECRAFPGKPGIYEKVPISESCLCGGMYCQHPILHRMCPEQRPDTEYVSRLMLKECGIRGPFEIGSLFTWGGSRFEVIDRPWDRDAYLVRKVRQPRSS